MTGRGRWLVWGAAMAAPVALAAIACGDDDPSPAPTAPGDAGTEASGGDAGGASDGGGGDATPDASPRTDPPTGDAIAGLELFDGWTDPRELPPPVTSIGWEDSSFISPDGTTLYFGYARFDFTALSQGQLLVTGPMRPGHEGVGFDVYEARIGATGWDVTRSTVNSPGEVSEAAQAVDRAQKTMLFVRFEGAVGDIHASTKQPSGAWGAATKLPAPINTPCVEDNVHLTPDGARMFFDSNRADDTGTTCKAESDRDIWTATWNGSAWSAPTKLSGGPNATARRWQPFSSPSGDVVYWSGYDLPDCPSGSCIYKASLGDGGTYGAPVMVARAAPGDASKIGQAYAIGEVSMTEDGRYMYFTYIKVAPPRDAGAPDAEAGPPVIQGDVGLGVARRK